MVLKGLGRATGLLTFYEGSLRTALIDLFPGIDLKLFANQAEKINWHTILHQETEQ